ncbi:hypothetical protein LEN26_014461 [Aphanomyces euteiches]|nr:hypothetical protein LEN26_014461 [Aphanomyces euteiches]
MLFVFYLHFEEDLHFLFAVDKELNDELTYVCDLLVESTSPKTSSVGEDCTTQPSTDEETRLIVKAPAPRKKNKFRERQRNEIQTLRKHIQILKETLLDMRQRAKVGTSSKWERAAREEYFAKTKAMQENYNLRLEVKDLGAFIENMKRSIRKRPRSSLISDTQAEAWQTYKLPAQASLRVIAMHAIADRQLNRVQMAFIQSGLFDALNELKKVSTRVQPDNTILVETTFSRWIPVPWRIVSATAWDVANGTSSPPPPEGATETREWIDPWTLYRAFHRVENGQSVHNNCVWKYYNQADRDVIVWRSILDDALIPPMADAIVGNEWGWIVMERDEASGYCHMKALVQMLVSTNGNANSTIEEIQRDCTAAKREYYSASGISSDLKERLPFGLRAFFDRSKQVQVAMEAAVCGLIEINGFTMDPIALDFEISA